MNHDYTISVIDGIFCFERDHGPCYGGIHQHRVDSCDKKGDDLFDQIEEFLGLDPANAAREEGYC